MFPYVYTDTSTTCPLLFPQGKTLFKARMYKLLSGSIRGQCNSHLIPEVLVYLAEGDLATKKMACLFISRIRTFKEEMFLVVNTLMQYCEHSNPVIKSLALKTIVSLQQECIAEMVSDKCMECLDCKNPFVRRAAVLGCAKLFRQWQCLNYRRKNLLAKLYSMLDDPDIIVVLNAMHAIEDIFFLGFIPDRRTAIRLSSKLKDYPAILRPTLLHYLYKYDTDSADDALALMNSLELFLNGEQQRPCIAATALPIFVKHVEKHIPTCISQVGLRFRDCLCSCLIKESKEMSYAIICCIKTTLKLQLTPNSRHYSLFFWRLEEPAYLQHEKLSVLQELTTSINLNEVLSDMKSMFEIETKETTLVSGVLVLSNICTNNACQVPSINLLFEIIKNNRTSHVVIVAILTELLKQRHHIEPLDDFFETQFLEFILQWINFPNLNSRALTLAIFHLGNRITFWNEPELEEDEVPAVVDKSEKRLRLNSDQLKFFDETVMKLGKLLEIHKFYELTGSSYDLSENLVPVLSALMTAVVQLYLVNPFSCQALLNQILLICYHCNDPILRSRAISLKICLEKVEPA